MLSFIALTKGNSPLQPRGFDLSPTDPKMNAIAAVESVDHPSDGALVAYARRYFKAVDRMNPQMQQFRDRLAPAPAPMDST